MSRITLEPGDIVAIVDTREQAPLDLLLPRVEVATLRGADYSVKHLEHRIAIERKSLPDLVACVGRERERFEACIKRMKAYDYPALVLETSIDEISLGGWRGKITPGQVKGALYSWGKHVNVFPAGSRKSAAAVVSGMLLSAAREYRRELRAFEEDLKRKGIA